MLADFFDRLRADPVLPAVFVWQCVLCGYQGGNLTGIMPRIVLRPGPDGDEILRKCPNCGAIESCLWLSSTTSNRPPSISFFPPT